MGDQVEMEPHRVCPSSRSGLGFDGLRSLTLDVAMTELSKIGRDSGAVTF
jgi:hypothetical protein